MFYGHLYLLLAYIILSSLCFVLFCFFVIITMALFLFKVTGVSRVSQHALGKKQGGGAEAN